ncbi:hypothetical protein [Paenibacillus daejeonensis]|uniref:hypothetical protein n=1 Tax=Paenibacillus daejeonensis TaxID=135193 RepID=UPI0012FC8EE7|nr:hypothetical protein [Paenibacillus daejeonensis]
MRTISMLILLSGIILIIASSCNTHPQIKGEEAAAVALLKSKGFTIHSSLGEVSSYQLEKDMMTRPPYMNIWAVQDVAPEQYWGKKVTVYGYVVTNHPLEKIYASIYNDQPYETQVSVLYVDGQAVGGTSSPVSKNGAASLGGPYSIDGQTLEEITGMTYKDWLAAWEEKYGSYKPSGEH